MHDKGRMFLFNTFIKQGLIGVEIGVWKGHFTRILIEHAKPRELHLIDPWDLPPERRYVPVSDYERTPDILREEYPSLIDKHLFIHKGYSQDVASHFSDRYFDWIYIDGDHSYEGALSDMRLYVPKLKDDGVLICDDYTDHYPWGDGVMIAVDEVVKEQGLIFETLINEQAIIRKP